MKSYRVFLASEEVNSFDNPEDASEFAYAIADGRTEYNCDAPIFYESESGIEKFEAHVIGKSGRDYEVLFKGTPSECKDYIQGYHGYHEDLTMTDELDWMIEFDS